MLLVFFLLAIFLSCQHITKKLHVYGVCEYYTYMYQTALLQVMCLFWFGAVYKLEPQNCLQRGIAFSFGHFWSFCSHIFGMAQIVRPHPDYLMDALQAAMSLLETNCE